jgi:SAM-dependent methyltransferase
MPETITPSTALPLDTARSSYWSAIAGTWQHGRDQTWRAHSDAVNAALCRRWLPVGAAKRLLKTDLFDEAVAAGIVPALASRADGVYAIDTSEKTVGLARGRYPAVRGTSADVRSLPFADAAFDAVVSNSTLDHFAHAGDITTAIEELHRVLAPGGRLVLTLDNAANPVVALRNALPFHWLSRLHLVPYFVGATLGPTTTTAVLERAGFRVIEVTAIVHCPRVLAVPLARLTEMAGPPWPTRLLRALAWMERAEHWPTRFRTGHFVAVLAEKRAGATALPAAANRP